MPYELPIAALFLVLSLAVAGKLGFFYALILALIGIVATTAATVVWTKRRRRCIAVALLAVTAGFSLWSLFGYLRVQPVQTVADGRYHTVTAYTTSDARDQGEYYSYDITVCGHDSAAPKTFSAKLTTQQPLTVQPYEEFEASLRFDTIDRNGGSWSHYQFVKASPERRQPILPTGNTHTTVLSWTVSVHRAVDTALEKTMSAENAGMIKGVLLGDRNDMADEDVANFRACGVTHVTAVSGLHTSLIAAVITFLLMLLRVPKRFAGLIACFVLLAFLAVIGFPLSAVRAAVMFAVFSLGMLLLKETHPVISLAVAVVVICLFDPAAACDVGFLLSVSATLGILLLGGQFKQILGLDRFYDTLWGKALNKLCDLLGMSISASLFTLPIVYLYYREFSLLAPLANLVVVPLAQISVITGALGCAAYLCGAPSAVFSAVLRVAQVCAEGMRRFCAWLVTWPVTTLHIGYAFIGVCIACCLVLLAVLMFVRPNFRKTLLCIALCIAVFLCGAVSHALANRGMTTVIAVDTPSGCSVVLVQGSRAVAIGACERGYELQRIVRSKGLTCVEKLILPSLEEPFAQGADELITQNFAQEVIAASQGNCRETLEMLLPAENFHQNLAQTPIFAFDDTVIVCYNTYVILQIGVLRILIALPGYTYQPEHGTFSLVICSSAGAGGIPNNAAEAAFVVGDETRTMPISTQLKNHGIPTYTTGGAGSLVLQTRGATQYKLSRQE